MTQENNTGKKVIVNDGYTPSKLTTVSQKPDKLPKNGYTTRSGPETTYAPPPRKK
ncbi:MULTISPECIES: hypothetical protein [unclassified Acinetobacter]|uniref:hypothetical protein n=1 Tax=unclassified Acinetobacter TaxID=196816 RepID=UPI0015D35F58|nr:MULTISPECIES: hypothetical protein [unclassified Acinetobacter]